MVTSKSTDQQVADETSYIVAIALGKIMQRRLARRTCYTSIDTHLFDLDVEKVMTMMMMMVVVVRWWSWLSR